MRFDFALTHEELERVWGSPLPRASEKGYPEIFDKMCHWVMFDGDTPIAYTSSLTMSEKYALVGNTYVRKGWRNKGLHTILLDFRNNSPHLKNRSKVTVVNPIEESQLQNLISVISKLGYTNVQNIDDISDLMPEWLYHSISEAGKQIWRLDYERN